MPLVRLPQRSISDSAIARRRPRDGNAKMAPDPLSIPGLTPLRPSAYSTPRLTSQEPLRAPHWRGIMELAIGIVRKMRAIRIGRHCRLDNPTWRNKIAQRELSLRAIRSKGACVRMLPPWAALRYHLMACRDIAGNTGAALIGPAEVILRVAVVSPRQPCERRRSPWRVILRNALAIDVEYSEIHLRPRRALIGCLCIPMGRSFVILGKSTAVPIHRRQTNLAVSIVLIGPLGVPFGRELFVAGDATPFLVQIGHLGLAVGRRPAPPPTGTSASASP